MIHVDDDFCSIWPRAVSGDPLSITATSGEVHEVVPAATADRAGLLKLRLLRIPVKAPYRLSDMAEDTAA